MATATAILAILASIVSIAGGLGELGIQITQSIGNIRNTKLRQTIQQMVSGITKAINEKRVSVSKILSLLQAKNSSALANYVLTNPAIGVNYNAIQNDSALLSAMAAEQNTIEARITDIQNQLNQIGYGNIFTHGEDEQRKSKLEEELNNERTKYEQLEQRAKEFKSSAESTITPYTKDLEAINQNTTGGMIHAKIQS